MIIIINNYRISQIKSNLSSFSNFLDERRLFGSVRISATNVSVCVLFVNESATIVKQTHLDVIYRKTQAARVYRAAISYQQQQYATIAMVDRSAENFLRQRELRQNCSSPGLFV